MLIDLNAYELLKEETIEELKSEGLVLKHKKSGARVIVLSNEDNNKVFSIGFRTPPEDSTGVAHILEHSVLCGSKKFPAKDPFIELAKGSLNTFLNAMTYSDKTIYPIASCNDKDFQNLMDVYLNSVFYPNIYQKEEIFKQEGWHYELESQDAELKYNGVVYNEMKGVFSSPEQQLYRLIQQSVFPDTTYGNESGGDPEFIPDLTYEDFLNFHKRYYHPSNSYIYLYGDMDVKEKLSWIDENYLSHFEYAPIDSEIPLQPAFPERREVTAQYSIVESDSMEEKTYLSYNTVIGTSLDRELYLAFQVLDYVLLSAPGAPLKQALIDAGIGKDILSSYDNGIQQTVFSIIAKNTEEDRKEEFLDVIQKTLSDIVKKGIDEKALKAAINYFEFKYREADFGQYPKGLMYGLQIFDSWLYDDSKPFIHICANQTFQLMKDKIGSGYFEGLIEEYLIQNTHASLVIVKPEIGLTARLENAVKEKLAAYKSGLTQTECNALVEGTKQLLQYQDTPSTKEELELIPLLSREDIGRKAEPVYNQEKMISSVKIMHHDIFTNGIAYVRMAFDITDLYQSAPYLGLLSTILGYIDTDHYSFLEYSNEVNIHTGGIVTDVNTYSKSGVINQYQVKFEIKTKVLYNQMDKAFSLIEEMLDHTKLEDEKRLKEIISESKSRLQMKLTSAGHSTAVSRATAYFSESAYFNDYTSGIGYYRFLEKLDTGFEQEKGKLIHNLKLLLNGIFNKSHLLVSFTGDGEGYTALEANLPAFLDTLKEKDALDSKITAYPDMNKPVSLNEGFKTPGKVQYVARTGNFIKEGFSYTGALRVLKVILSYDYLWNNIRVKGGAYGCMCGFSFDGNGYFTSYRDPNLSETNAVYEQAFSYVSEFTADERDMTKYIIGTISNVDTPMNPNAKGSRSFTTYLTEISMEDIQRERDEILNVTVEDIRKTAQIVKAILDEGNICVIGNENKIEENKDLFLTIDKLV
jgi:Predicted Zn-dependent peptidases, insulinase-like